MAAPAAAIAGYPAPTTASTCQLRAAWPRAPARRPASCTGPTALGRCRRARAGGLPIHVQTRPLSLHLTRSRVTEPGAATYAGAPPPREQAGRDALRRGLAAGGLLHVITESLSRSSRHLIGAPIARR
jgi:hypothetical protein